MTKPLALWPELQKAIDERGLPLIFEGTDGTQYVLLQVTVDAAELAGFRAYHILTNSFRSLVKARPEKMPFWPSRKPLER